MKAIIIVDTREKKNQHILNRLDKLGIKYIVQKLDYGDYSFIWNGIDYSDKVVVERKATFSEIAGNFTKGKQRFKNEFERAKWANVYLVIEEPESCLNSHSYRSSMPVKELKGKIKTWCNKYQLKLKYTTKEQSADLILSCFREFIKKQGGVKHD